jgi:hypothetical protein
MSIIGRRPGRFRLQWTLTAARFERVAASNGTDSLASVGKSACTCCDFAFPALSGGQAVAGGGVRISHQHDAVMPQA